VVVSEILPYALVVGNPSRQIGWMSEYGHRLEFNSEGLAVCPESGEEYRLNEDKVIKTGSTHE
jgi:UDP-2-acetamido-3-amino-2,3-dideoxy-glucuronate N-acetyltransferase